MSSEAQAERPALAIIHHMARTGGTVICRCLASMENVVLLSEIHPLGVRMFNPLEQAHSWYGLLAPQDLPSGKSAAMNFSQAIQLIWERCQAAGKTLVLRDWSHLDFTGVPFTQPGYRSLLVESLQGDFKLLRHATVRHPVDQWLSLSRQQVYRRKLGQARFLKGYEEFARFAEAAGFSRYEDFTRNPTSVLKTICKALNVEFDANYEGKWQDYRNITGDVLPGRAGRKITRLDRQAGDEVELKVFRGLPEYQDAIERLGYSP